MNTKFSPHADEPYTRVVRSFRTLNRLGRSYNDHKSDKWGSCQQYRRNEKAVHLYHHAPCESHDRLRCILTAALATYLDSPGRVVGRCYNIGPFSRRSFPLKSTESVCHRLYLWYEARESCPNFITFRVFLKPTFVDNVRFLENNVLTTLPFDLFDGVENLEFL